MIKHYLLGAALFMSLSLPAQTFHRCSSMEVKEAQEKADPSIKIQREHIEQEVNRFIQNGNKTAAVITIPVVVHVVFNNTTQNISDAKVQAQIAQLNLDFARLNTDASNTPSAFSTLAANTQIQFCLAQRDPNGNPTSGIIHKQTSITSFSSNDAVKKSAQGGSDAWPAGSYLNIWSCNLGGGLLGYAQFPGGTAATDGVVLLYSSIGSMLSPGTATPYNLGRTATHEVGHWLGLYHIWGDDGTACTGTDQVTDTPNQAGENYGCPAFPKVSCSNGPNGDMFMNYMDYTDDACMNMFSTGQATRMTSILNTTRISLQSSTGCTPSTVTCGTPTGLASSALTTTGATISWTAVSGATSYNVQYKTTAASTWTTTTATTTSKAITGLTAGTSYNYQIQAVCTGGSSSYSTAGIFTTASATCNDTYEPNNSTGQSKVIALNTYINAKINNSADKDFFKITTLSSAPNLRVTLDQLPLNYNLTLYNQIGTILATSSNTGTTADVIIRNATNAATYYIRIVGQGGVSSNTACYRLIANTSSTTFRLTDPDLPEFDPTARVTIVDDVQGMDGFTLFPNPASEKISLSFTSDESGSMQIEVIDMIGKIISTKEIITEEGINNTEISLENIRNGIYFLRMQDNGNTVVRKFIVKK